VVALGRPLRARSGVLTPVMAAFAGGFMFFVVTNLAVFAGSLYPHTWSGLGACFTMALPFYRNQIVGDVLFTSALFGLHAAAKSVYAQRTAVA
jgi:hypothetical protein